MAVIDDQDDEALTGELLPVDFDEADVVDTEDGGALVKIGDEEAPAEDDKFMANLAETIPETELNPIATTLLELIERDIEARKGRDEQQEEGLRRTGLGDDAPGGASFQGASKVVHPMMTEACVDFAARAIKELFPPGGPVKDFIPGDVTDAKVKKAKRKTAYMNWQLTTQSLEFRAELEQLLTQVPLGGAQYLKASWDKPKNRPGFLFIAIDDMLLPYAATNFYSADRKTHRQYITALEYKARVRSGMYRDVDLIGDSHEPDVSLSEKANNKIEGRQETSYNEDGLRAVMEVYVTLDLSKFDRLAETEAPYIVTVDKTSTKILSIYRNWDEEDGAKEELTWIVEFPFIPWRGAYPIGLPHMIGGLAAASTGALRALLDSAHIANQPSGLKLKGSRVGGQSINLQPTQIAEIEGGLNVDDIRKVYMPLPFNPPSVVLFSLLGSLVDMGKGVVRTSLDDVSEGNQNAPVGTTLAKIEQGLVVYSAIHARLHNAMQRLLSILHRMDAAYLDEKEATEALGETVATRADFQGAMDVVPVSDPNIFSEAQRFAQVQAVAQRSAAFPQLYNARKVEERILDTLRIPNAMELLAPGTEGDEADAVTENVNASLGKPCTAFREQDHIAHLATHCAFLVSPALGANELIAPSFIPIMLNHIKEHIVQWYAVEAKREASTALGEDIDAAYKQSRKRNDADEERSFDVLLAEASQNVSEGASKAFGSLPAIIKQARALLQQLVQQASMGAPADPKTAVQQAEVQRKQAADQQNAQIKGQELQLKAQEMQGGTALDQQKLQLDAQGLQLDAQDVQLDQQLAERQLQQDMADAEANRQAEAERIMLQQEAETQRAELERVSRETMNEADNFTAMQLAAMEIETGERFGVSTGTGVNPGT